MIVFAGFWYIFPYIGYEGFLVSAPVRLVSVACPRLAAAPPARFGPRLQRYGDEVQTVLSGNQTRRVGTKGALKKRFLRSRKIFYRSIKIFERRLRQEQVITVSEVAIAGAKYGPGCK